MLDENKNDYFFSDKEIMLNEVNEYWFQGVKK